LPVLYEVPVKLTWLWVAGLDDDVLAAEPLQAPVGHVRATYDATDEPHPVETVARREHGYVEHSVVGPGVRQQHQPTLKLADVAYQDGAHSAFDRLSVIDRDGDLGSDVLLRRP